MDDLESTVALSQFASSSRSGRRNAVAEIDVESIDPSGEKLATRFAQLGSEEGQSARTQSDEGPSTFQGPSPPSTS